jgi:hypothetical protein
MTPQFCRLQNGEDKDRNRKSNKIWYKGKYIEESFKLHSARKEKMRKKRGFNRSRCVCVR